MIWSCSTIAIKLKIVTVEAIETDKSLHSANFFRNTDGLNDSWTVLSHLHKGLHF